MDSALDTEAGTAAIAAASNKLTGQWAGRIADGQSTVFSGAGVWPLLGLLALGADEPARTELAGAYGLDPAQAGTAARRFVDLFDRAPALRAALGLWYRDALTVRESWLDQLPPATRGQLTGDLAADKARLDAWAREHTGGLIERMPVNLTPQTLFVLASAILVKTAWATPFAETSHQPVDGPWADGRRLASLTRSVEPNAVRVLDADPSGPHDNSPTGRVTMSVVAGSDDIDVLLFLGEPEAPADRVLTTGLAAVGQEPPGTAAAELTGEHPGPGITVGTIRSTSDRPITTLDAIRFTIRSGHDLLAEPELFGLKTAGDPSTAGFSGISDTALYVSSANQDAMAQFSATGFEAAAVTVVSMSRTAMMRTREFDVRHTTVTYDRPFGFAAVHRTSGLILVAGWVADPE